MTRGLFAIGAVFAMLATMAGADEQMVIEDFDYPSAEAAQQEWIPDEDSLPVSIMDREDGGTALRLNADFTGDSGRAVYDKDVDLDLSRWGRFTLDFYVEDPGLFRSFTLYLRSGDGWYGGGLGMGRKGWNTLSISRSAFGIEGTPSGWDQIDGIRLSAWRGAEGTGFCAVDNLVAHRETRCVVMGTAAIAAGSSEARTVREQAETMSRLLEDAGIMTSTIGDEDVEQGALEDFDIAIFPYNPVMSEAEVQAIAEYVDRGGSIFVFYSLPDGLEDVLGIREVGYLGREYEGQFATIDFVETEKFMGLPDEVGQGSWNITVAEPIEGVSEVIGWWQNADGERTEYPAVLASDAGIFMAHVLLSTDYSAKQRMMTALIGRYDPTVWPQVAQNALRGPEQVGHIRGANEAMAWIRERADQAPDPAAVREALADAEQMLQTARDSIEEGKFPAVVDQGTQAWERLGEAYALVHQPRDAEFRAWWNHSGTGAYDTWEKSMENLEAGGFNAIVPNMLWGGVALYESDYLPEAPVVAERGDQIAECVAAAKRHGIEVHPWKVNWNLGGSRAPEEFVQQLREEGRLQMDMQGNEILWLCPSDPRNFELELNTMVEVARKYDVDGVHFDYIRYPGKQGCYCPGCRQRFQEQTGITVPNWPEDLWTEEYQDAWVQWRCDNISRLVEATAREVRAIKPDCKISAAVFSQYPDCRVSVGQDWVHWIEQGWLDFVCPMDYIESDTSFATTVATQLSHIQGRIPFYPGIGAWRLKGADRVAGQIHIARALGTDGFILFNYSADLAETIAPVTGQALLSEPAVMPHNAPPYTFEVEGELTRESTWGRHVEPGATVEVTVRLAEGIEGRTYDEIDAAVVLEDVNGNIVSRLCPAPVGEEPVVVSISAEEGLHRVAVRGRYVDEDGQQQRFVIRSIPIVFGSISDEIAEML